MNQCGGRISARDAYIIENLHTWCGTATCMCFMEKTAFVWHCDQHQIRVSRMVFMLCTCVRACVRACVRVCVRA